jgi:hypothetical protein
MGMTIFPQASPQPFYFASVSSIWIYFLVPPENVGPFLADKPVQPALFDGQAMALLNFQRFTAHFASAMSVTNEAQFNIVAYPTIPAAQVPQISVADLLAGGEQTKLIGAFRLWVPADNPAAVQGGAEMFYEPTFLTTFTYAVPDLNDPAQTSWDVMCNDPADPMKLIFTLEVPTPPGVSTSVMSPVTQYTLNPQGRLFSYGWNLNGTFESALIDAAGATIELGSSSHPMRAAMEAVLAGAVPVGVQIFNSPPAAASPRGFLVQ